MRSLLAIVTVLALCPEPAAAQDAASRTPALSVEEQNRLVKMRCQVCHGTNVQKGGLSFAEFDAARPDRVMAHLMKIKIDADQAMMAAGKPVPDTTTVKAFSAALDDAI